MIKFKKNSFVYIKKLGDCKKHFYQERAAGVNYTYYEEYGGNSDQCKQIYDLKVKNWPL